MLQRLVCFRWNEQKRAVREAHPPYLLALARWPHAERKLPLSSEAQRGDNLGLPLVLVPPDARLAVRIHLDQATVERPGNGLHALPDGKHQRSPLLRVLRLGVVPVLRAVLLRAPFRDGVATVHAYDFWRHLHGEESAEQGIRLV